MHYIDNKQKANDKKLNTQKENINKKQAHQIPKQYYMLVRMN